MAKKLTSPEDDNNNEKEEDIQEAEETSSEENSEETVAETSTGKKKGKKSETPELFKKRTTKKDFSTVFMLTGNVAFDLAVSDGRGLPIGDFIMISAPKGTGKSTLCYDLVSKLLKKHKNNKIPFRAMHIDIEGSSTLAESFGLKDYVDSGELVHYTGQVTYVQLEKLYDAIIKKNADVKDIKFIIIDSIAGVTTQGMIEKDVEKAHFGLTAKAASEFFKKFTPLCKEHGITTLMINHERTEQGSGNAFTGPLKKEAGGDAAMYMASVLLRLSKSQRNADDIKKRKEKTVQGEKELSDKFYVTIKSPDKNRYCKIGEVEMLVEAGKRIIDSFAVREILINLGFIKKVKSGNTNAYEVHEDFCNKDILGKKITVQELNKHVSRNQQLFMEYLISKGLFKYRIEEDAEDPDGWL